MRINPRMILRPDVKDRVLRCQENLFLLLTAIYLFTAMKGMTMFRLSLPKSFLPNLQLAMLLLALVRLVLGRHERPGIWLGLLLACAYMASYLTTAYSRLPFLAIMVIGLEGIDGKKILRTYLCTVGGVLAAALLAGLGGGITNLVYVRDGLRSCWGTAYPTDFSTMVLFLTMAAWLAWQGLPDWAMLAFGLVPLGLAYFFTGSRTSLMCSALFELVVCYHWLESGALDRNGGRKAIKRVVDVLLMVAAPLCAMLVFVTVLMYVRNPEAMQRVDDLVTFRLRLSAEGLQAYGLKPFGSVIEMNGGLGGTVFPKGELFFLDSSYMNILLRYGWVTMLAMFAVWEWMLRKALSGGNRRMALVMAVVAVHSIMEHHFADPFDNILLVMPLAILRIEPKRDAAERPALYRGVFGAVLAALLALGMLFLPTVLSGLRTIYAAKGWQGGGDNALPVLCLNLAIVALVVGGAWAAYRLLLDALARRRIGRVAACVLVLCLALGVGVGAWGNRVIARAARDNAAMVDSDADALACLSESDIYVDVMPEVYRQRFADVRRTIWGGDDLVRIPNAVLLLENRPEHRLLLDRGFKYVQISDAHALYVSDADALAALEAHGYAPSDYYNTVVGVDLEKLATRNKLTRDARGVLLDGPKHSLKKGPDDDLFHGDYVVEYSLFLPEGASEAEGEICELRVSNKNLGAIANVVVSRDEFDSQGSATISLPFTLVGDTIDVRFQVIAREDRQVGVEGIDYRQTS